MPGSSAPPDTVGLGAGAVYWSSSSSEMTRPAGRGPILPGVHLEQSLVGVVEHRVGRAGAGGEGAKKTRFVKDGVSSATDWVWTVVPTDLDHTLEVDVHGVWELEGLEVCV